MARIWDLSSVPIRRIASLIAAPPCADSAASPGEATALLQLAGTETTTSAIASCGRPFAQLLTSGQWIRCLFLPGTVTNELIAAVQPTAREPLYRKRVNSAFIGTSLERDLRARRIDTLVVAGLTTDHCISTSVRMAGNLGFTVLVVDDATATFDRAGVGDGSTYTYPAELMHRTALASLQDEFAIVVSADVVGRGLAMADGVRLAG